MKLNPLKKIDLRKKWKGVIGTITSIGSNPQTDWQIVFFACTFLAFVGIAFGALTFYRVNNGTLYNVSQKKIAKVTTIDRKALRDIIEYFELKDAKYRALKAQKNAYVDPSL